MTNLPFRQVHLDFHTSPHIPDIAIDFDPVEFVETLRIGHVNSVTVFAKCHHGYSYYGTKIGTVHPHLTRPDLLGEMIEAGHQAGIRVPVYTTITWDELAWETHPEWRHVSPDGCIVGPSTSVLTPGWKNLCMNTTYGDYVIAQIEEILDLYDGDGFFIDIARYGPITCACATCLAQMVGEGFDPTDPIELREFTRRVERRFMDRTTAAIRAKDATQDIFYNSRLRMELDPQYGNRAELDNFTHLEIESLPGGEWGYDHFPMYVRYFDTFSRDLVAMTGRFHTTWGDFGGLRNRAALEFESFQALAHGATISIGDQLHPRGKLDPAVYARIGEVYAEVEKREQWCTATSSLAEIGVFTADFRVGSHSGDLNPIDVGALHVLEQSKFQFHFLDTAADFSAYALLILPDAISVDADLAGRLRNYLSAGGKLLISGRSSLDDETGDFLLSQEMGVTYAGPAPFYPDYILLDPDLADGVEDTYHSSALPGVRVTARTEAQVLAWSGRPYFNRTWRHFCSHQYTPFDANSGDPVITQQGNVIYVARPLFSEYAESAKRVHKQILDNCIRRLLPRPLVGSHNLPSTAVVTLRQQGQDVLLHLLHYVHQRRGRNLDVIEDVLPLYDISLDVRLAHEPASVRLVPEDTPVQWSWQDGYVHLQIPRINGYQIVQLHLAASAHT